METGKQAYLIYDTSPYSSKDVVAVALTLEEAKKFAEQRTSEELQGWQRNPAGRNWVTKYKWLFKWVDNEPREDEWRYLLGQDEHKHDEDNEYQCWFYVRRVKHL